MLSDSDFSPKMVPIFSHYETPFCCLLVPWTLVISASSHTGAYDYEYLKKVVSQACRQTRTLYTLHHGKESRLARKTALIQLAKCRMGPLSGTTAEAEIFVSNPRGLFTGGRGGGLREGKGRGKEALQGGSGKTMTAEIKRPFISSLLARAQCACGDGRRLTGRHFHFMVWA